MRTSVAATLFAAAAGLGLAAADPAGQIVLVPTRLFLAPGEVATSLTVRNETDAPANFSVRVFAWRNSETGDVQLDPTDDLMVFPETLNLVPGETRRVRLGSRRPATERLTIERSYRLILESLADPRPAASAGLTIKTRFQFSLPVFMQPRDRTARVSMQPPIVTGGRASIALTNAGVFHVTPTKIELNGLDADGRVVWTRPLQPWYVLAGETRRLSVELTPAECRQTTTIAAEATFAEGERLTLREKRAVQPAGVCATP